MTIALSPALAVGPVNIFAEVPVKLGAGNPTPDVYMVWSYGQAANAGWLESLDQHFDNPNLFHYVHLKLYN